MSHPDNFVICDICPCYEFCELEEDVCSRYKSCSTVDLIEKVCDMDSKNGRVRSNFVIEECAELIAEMANTYREGKENVDKIIDEACDVLTTVFVLLYSYGVSGGYVKSRIDYKCIRALNKEDKK